MRIRQRSAGRPASPVKMAKTPPNGAIQYGDKHAVIDHELCAKTATYVNTYVQEES